MINYLTMIYKVKAAIHCRLVHKVPATTATAAVVAAAAVPFAVGSASDLFLTAFRHGEVFLTGESRIPLINTSLVLWLYSALNGCGRGFTS